MITNNHNQAIIIENKLNYTPNQPTQIVRYMGINKNLSKIKN